MNKLPELLAPAGSLESLKAAVYAGADAVYFGVPQFNARMKAKNFTASELDEAFSLCALHGVKTHITLNTLLFGREIKKALEVVSELEGTYRPDAYIVQDLGLAYELKKRFPDIVLHASTQAEVHNAYGLEPFCRLGFSRVVIAREVNRDEIAAFRDCGIETEIFIHGAVCVCQSGGCLMSSLIGGRSGNRGECAYPCRLPYKGKNPYPLSLKDMCLAEHIPEIISLGVTALKIEGRMKPPSYVYEVTSLYRRLLDENRSATPEEIRRQQAVFSRSGFSDGYFISKINSSMFGIRSDADKENSRGVITEISEKKLPTELDASLRIGSPSVLKLSCNRASATVYGEEVLAAQNKPLSSSEVEARLSKLGNTPFSAKNVRVDVEDGAYMTVSSLNALRRDGADALIKALTSSRVRECGIPADIPEISKKTTVPGLVIRMGRAPNADHLDAAVRYEIPLEQTAIWKPLVNSYKEKLCLIIPRTVYDTQLGEVKALLLEASKSGISMICAENPEFLCLAKDFSIFGGLCLNVTNKSTASVLNSLGFAQITVSPEANMALAAEINAAYAVYGKLPLMYTRTCIITNQRGCMKNRDPHLCRAQLTDRTGAEFTVVGGYAHTNTVYNSVPLWLLDRPITTENPLLYFTTESKNEENFVLKAYYDKTPSHTPFTRGAC